MVAVIVVVVIASPSRSQSQSTFAFRSCSKSRAAVVVNSTHTNLAAGASAPAVRQISCQIIRRNRSSRIQDRSQSASQPAFEVSAHIIVYIRALRTRGFRCRCHHHVCACAYALRLYISCIIVVYVCVGVCRLQVHLICVYGTLFKVNGICIILR